MKRTGNSKHVCATSLTRSKYAIRSPHCCDIFLKRIPNNVKYPRHVHPQHHLDNLRMLHLHPQSRHRHRRRKPPTRPVPPENKRLLQLRSTKFVRRTTRLTLLYAIRAQPRRKRPSQTNSEYHHEFLHSHAWNEQTHNYTYWYINGDGWTLVGIESDSRRVDPNAISCAITQELAVYYVCDPSYSRASDVLAINASEYYVQDCGMGVSFCTVESEAFVHGQGCEERKGDVVRSGFGELDAWVYV